MEQQRTIVLYVSNYIKDEKEYIKVKKDKEETECFEVQLGEDKTENTKKRIIENVEKILEENQKKTVHIIYHCNTERIHKPENDAVKEAFGELSKNNKEVFFSEKMDEQ